MKISFTVLGTPAPQGSMKAITTKRGKIRLISQLKTTMPWRQQVGWTALEARAKAGYHEIPFGKHVPVSVVLKFYFQRPPSIPKRRTMPSVPPDWDKLARNASDALTGVFYVDDGQIVRAAVEKNYDNLPRVEISVESVES